MTFKIRVPRYIEQEELRKDLEDLNCSPWKIDVPYENDVSWCVILSYLLQIEERRIKEIFPLCSDYDYGEIRKQRKSFNPFLKREAYCFYSPVFRRLVVQLEEQLKEYVNSPEFKAMESLKCREELRIKLAQAAAVVLKVKIILFLERRLSDSTVRTEHVVISSEAGTTTRDEVVILFWKVVDTVKHWDRVTFSLRKEKAKNLRKSALEKILGNIGVTLSVAEQYIFLTQETRENLIKALLKNREAALRSKFLDIAKKLLRSPRLIMLKLCHAGFDTYPEASEENDKRRKATFLFVLREIEGGEEFLFPIYNCYIDTPFWSENAIREPNDILKANLSGLSRILNEAKCELLKTNKDLLVPLEELIAFHEFQVEVCEGIINTMGMSGVAMSKQIIISVIKAYVKYFHMTDTGSQQDTEREQYETYKRNKRFFHSLDCRAALFFFDHFFELKNIKVLEKSICSVETSFARFLFFWNFYHENINDLMPRSQITGPGSTQRGDGQTCDLRGDEKENFILPLCFLGRIELKRNIEDFLGILETTDISQVSDKKGYFRTLQDEPIIRDQCSLFRLRSAIDQALNVNLVRELEIGVALIERSLQVMGECFHRNIGVISFFEFLLNAALPETTKNVLRDIRDKLSHCEKVKLTSRIDVQTDAKCYEEMQRELKNVKSAFATIFELQDIRMRKRAIEYGIKVMENRLTACNQSDDPLGTNSHQLLENLRNNLSKTGNSLKKQSTHLTDIYKAHFETNFDFIVECMRKLQTRRIVKTIKYCFDSVELLLRFILEEVMDEDVKLQKKLPGSLNDAIYTNNDERLKIYKILYSNIFSVGVSSPKNAFQSVKINKTVFETYLSIMKEILPESSKKMIRQSVKEKYIQHHEAKLKLVDDLERNAAKSHGMVMMQKGVSTAGPGIICNNIPIGNISHYEVDVCVTKLVLDEKERSRVKDLYYARNLQCLKEVVDHYGTLEEALEKKKLKKSDLLIIRGNLIPEEKIHCIFRLESLVPNLHDVKDDNYSFFFDRLLRLERILIEWDFHVRNIWWGSRSARTQEYMCRTIAEKYLREPKLQQAVDQLLFDCFNAIQDKNVRKNLKHLLIKRKYLFNGIDVRDIFAHGDSLFLCIGNVLDPYDFPNEVIKKAVELMKDIRNSYGDSINVRYLEWRKNV